MRPQVERPVRTFPSRNLFERLAVRSVGGRLAVIGFSYVLYILLFAHGYQYLGRVVGMASIIPILAGVHYFGIAGGLVCGLVAIPANTAILSVLGYTDLFSPSRLFVMVVMIAFGVASGAVRSASRRGRRSEDLLNIAFEAAQDGLWDYRVGTDEVYFSPRWFTMLGYQPDEFAHTFENWVRLLHPDDRDEALRVIEQVSDMGKPQFSVSFRMREKGGSWRWILSRGKVVELAPDGTAARLVGVHSDVSQLKRAEADLVYLAYHDQLTGLLNRKAFYERAELTLRHAERSTSEQLRAFLLIDLDNFKDVNDGFGHDFGDRLLKQAAWRLSHSIRQSDLLFRLGGDEFTIILTNIEREVDAALVASNLLRAFATPFVLDGHSVYTGISVGIALYPRDGNDAPDLIRKADTALYDSKRDRNTYRFYTLQMQNEAVRRMHILGSLRRAIDADELTLHYQPIIAKNGTVRGAEALLRWHCPDEGLKMPGEFIEVAEQTGLILDIGRWVLDRATRDAEQWRRAGLGDLHVSVNLSPRQLRERTIVADIEEALDHSGLPNELLMIELTENSFVDLSDESTDRLDAIRALGIKLAIDDFGTGYSSMSYLKRLPVDAIKIDRSFVVGVPINPQDVSIVEAVMTMAHGLGLKVVAEGVDDPEQIRFLSSRSCDAFQGYYFSRPVPSDDFQAMIAKGVGAPDPVGVLDVSLETD